MAAENEFLSSSTNKEERLYFLHNELEKLTNSCLQKNISYFQIKKSADSFLNFEKKCTNVSKIKLLTSVFTIISVCLIACYIEPSQRILSSFGRRTLIKVLPMVDWTSLHGVNCFIPNYFNEEEGRPLFEEDCQNCSSISGLDVLQTATMEEIANNYLYKDLPVIVHNSRSATENIAMQDIIQLYLDDDVMRLFTSCGFESNIKMKRKDHRRFLEDIRDKHTAQYYAHWENCFKEAAKLFRKVFSRPDALPTSVELTASNWIFICNNYTENKHIPLPYEDQVVILIQLSGSLDIRLRPREPCAQHCKDINTTIPEHGALFIPDFFYDIEYVTCNHGNSITVGLGGRLDI